MDSKDTPLLSDEDLRQRKNVWGTSWNILGTTVRDHYEAARQQDHATIEALRANLDAVLAAGDEMTKFAGSLTNLVLNLRGDERRGHFTPKDIQDITRRWKQVTQHIRKGEGH